MCIRKDPTFSIPESKIQPLFEKSVKMSCFQIFIDSDRKIAKLLYGIYCYSIAHFVLAQKRTDYEQKLAKLYNFALFKKSYQNLAAFFQF